MARKRCRQFKNGRVRLCDDLTQCNETNVRDVGRRVRIAEFVLTSLPSGSTKPHREAVVLHSGRHRHAGIEMHYCPFCGGDLKEYKG